MTKQETSGWLSMAIQEFACIEKRKHQIEKLKEKLQNKVSLLSVDEMEVYIKETEKILKELDEKKTKEGTVHHRTLLMLLAGFFFVCTTSVCYL